MKLILKSSEDFDALPETYVIFITEHDVIGRNEPIYTVERQIINIDEPFNDGEHIIYVNGEDKNSATELGRLMHDFFCTNPDDMHFKPLADKVRYFKEDERGVAAMCKVMEDMREAAAKEAVDRDRVDRARNLLQIGKLSVEEIANAMELSIEKVKELAMPKTV